MKKLNLLRKIIGFPFVVVFRIIYFIFVPLAIIIGFMTTNWEDDWERNYFLKEIKKEISFGFWK